MKHLYSSKTVALLLPVLAGVVLAGSLMLFRPAKACCSVQSDPKAISVLTAEAGKSYEFSIDPQSGFADYDRTFSAQFGTITPSGVYTAPDFIPDSGIDIITVHFANGPTDQIILHLSPQIGTVPEAPIIVPEGFIPVAQGDIQEPNMPSPAESDAFIHALDNLPNDGKWHEISEAPVISTTSRLADCIDPIEVVLAGKTYLRVPSTLSNNDPNSSIFLMLLEENAGLGGPTR